MRSVGIASFYGSGHVLGENRLVRLDLQEPDPRLFDLGENYESVGPSELRARQHQAGGEQIKASDFERLFPEIEREFLALRKEADAIGRCS